MSQESSSKDLITTGLTSSLGLSSSTTTEISNGIISCRLLAENSEVHTNTGINRIKLNTLVANDIFSPTGKVVVTNPEIFQLKIGEDGSVERDIWVAYFSNNEKTQKLNTIYTQRSERLIGKLDRAIGALNSMGLNSTASIGCNPLASGNFSFKVISSGNVCPRSVIETLIFRLFKKLLNESEAGTGQNSAERITQNGKHGVLVPNDVILKEGLLDAINQRNPAQLRHIAEQVKPFTLTAKVFQPTGSLLRAA